MNEEKPKIILQKPIRTYESDVADAIANKKTSVVTMAVAENEKKLEPKPATETPKPKYTRQILMVLLSIILIIGGISGGYYLYLKSPLAPVDIQKPVINIPSIITPDLQISLSIGNSEGNKLAQIITTESLQRNIENEKILEFILTISNGSTTPAITGSQFIQKMNFDMSDVLKRSLLDRWMIGVYAIDNQRLPFIVFSTDFFQNAFAGMLKWESSMPDEFINILNYKDKIISKDDTSTTSISSFFGIRGKFHDKIVYNRDVREFINERGELLFLYSFVNKDILIIATSEATLEALIKRIEKQTFVR